MYYFMANYFQLLRTYKKILTYSQIFNLLTNKRKMYKSQARKILTLIFPIFKIFIMHIPDTMMSNKLCVLTLYAAHSL